MRTVVAGTASKAAVGRVAGLAGEPWAKAWLDLRVELGLNVAKDKFPLPAPSPAGGFRQRRMRSEEQRHFAAAPGLQLSKQRVGSHSCKNTLLSWSAKCGLGKGTRRDLGYHSSPGDKKHVCL